MKLKAKVTIYAGEDVFAPGEVLLVKDEKEAQALIDRGFAEPTDEAVTKKAKVKVESKTE